MIFVDGASADRRNLSSQVGYVVTIVNETVQNDEAFTLLGHFIHWFSVKSKRVVRLVLGSEIYGMASGFDMGYVIRDTLTKAFAQLELPPLPLVVCRDSYSLYECLVKLGSTTKKRLMIDILALRQAFERREITEIRWISNDTNPADAMTKASLNGALKQLVNNNRLMVRLEGYMKRSGQKTG